MKIRPFIVTHDEKFCHMEGDLIENDDEYADSWQGECNYRYLVWAESHLDAAKTVQAHKKELGRILPDKYMVHGMSSKPHGTLTPLSDGVYPAEDQHDLETFEDMFEHGKEILL